MSDFQAILNNKYDDEEYVDVFDLFYPNYKKKPGRKTKETKEFEKSISKIKKTTKLTKNTLKNIEQTTENKVSLTDDLFESAVTKMCLGSSLQFPDNSVLESEYDKILGESLSISEENHKREQEDKYKRKQEELGMSKDFVPLVPAVQICDAKTAKNSCNRKEERVRKIQFKVTPIQKNAEEEIKERGESVTPSQYCALLKCNFSTNDPQVIKLFSCPHDSGLEGKLFYIKDEYVDGTFYLKQILCKIGKKTMYIFENTDLKNITTYTEQSLKDISELKILTSSNGGILEQS